MLHEPFHEILSNGHIQLSAQFYESPSILIGYRAITHVDVTVQVHSR